MVRPVFEQLGHILKSYSQPVMKLSGFGNGIFYHVFIEDEGHWRVSVHVRWMDCWLYCDERRAEPPPSPPLGWLQAGLTAADGCLLLHFRYCRYCRCGAGLGVVGLCAVCLFSSATAAVSQTSPVAGQGGSGQGAVHLSSSATAVAGGWAEQGAAGTARARCHLTSPTPPPPPPRPAFPSPSSPIRGDKRPLLRHCHSH